MHIPPEEWLDPHERGDDPELLEPRTPLDEWVSTMDFPQEEIVGAESEPNEYTGDWARVASELKRERGLRCEVCGFRGEVESDIQTHHVDGDKADNGRANLQLLCAICHGQKHGTGALSAGLTENQLRRVREHHLIKRGHR